MSVMSAAVVMMVAAAVVGTHREVSGAACAGDRSGAVRLVLWGRSKEFSSAAVGDSADDPGERLGYVNGAPTADGEAQGADQPAGDGGYLPGSGNGRR